MLLSLYDTDKQFKYEMQRTAQVSLGYISFTEILKNSLEMQCYAVKVMGFFGGGVYTHLFLLVCIDPENP